MSGEHVRVGDVLRLERREVHIDGEIEYSLIGVYSFGKGIFHRDPKPGVELGDYRFFCIEPGDLVLSNIQAWEGAIALATTRDSGTIGTHRFLSYVPRDRRKIDTNWARWFFLSEPGMERIRRAAPGTAVRNRTLAVKRFEDLVIPLPPIEDQRRVAARLDRVRIEVAGLDKRDRHAATLTPPLLNSWLNRLLGSGHHTAVLSDVATVARGRGPKYEVGTDTLSVNQGCVQWDGIDIARAREVATDWWAGVPGSGRVAVHDVLVNSTGEGTIGRAALATSDVVGLPFDSHVMAVRCHAAEVLPAYLVLYLRSPSGQDQIIAAKGANTTKQTELGKAKLERFVIPVPSIGYQSDMVTRFREIVGRVRRLDALTSAREKRLAALVAATVHSEFSRFVG